MVVMATAVKNKSKKSEKISISVILKRHFLQGNTRVDQFGY